MLGNTCGLIGMHGRILSWHFLPHFVPAPSSGHSKLQIQPFRCDFFFLLSTVCFLPHFVPATSCGHSKGQIQPFHSDLENVKQAGLNSFLITMVRKCSSNISSLKLKLLPFVDVSG